MCICLEEFTGHLCETVMESIERLHDKDNKSTVLQNTDLSMGIALAVYCVVIIALLSTFSLCVWKGYCCAAYYGKPKSPKPQRSQHC
jgi:hypothetical protein